MKTFVSLFLMIALLLVCGTAHAQVAGAASTTTSSSSSSTTTTTTAAPQIVQAPLTTFQAAPLALPTCPTFTAPAFAPSVGYGRSFGVNRFGSGFGYGHSVGFRSAFVTPHVARVNVVAAPVVATPVVTPGVNVNVVNNGRRGLFGRRQKTVIRIR